jgi:ADP-ribose pyrophosphatase YjhB (NUDIX family)
MEINSVGVFFYSKNTKRFLYLLRNDNKNNCWALPGGKLEYNETLLDGLKRECIEEINFWIDDLKLIPIQKFVNNDFTYNTFFCEISDEFMPKLNDEHLGYAWVTLENYPKPLHPGLFNLINFDIVREKINYLVN